MKNVEKNSFGAWWLAIRPKTLTGAAVPVVIALSAAFRDSGSFIWIPALLCLLFALFMQADANLVNDYFDCVDGLDTEERQGPERATSQGWVSLKSMRRAIVAVTLLSCMIGLPLILWGGYEMIWVGMACVAFCFLYTLFFSRRAFGDVLVLLFFGLVPVCATYYIQTNALTKELVMLSLACGMATDCMLVVNNYRDRETDIKVGKQTLATLMGAAPTRALYFLLGVAAVALSIPALGSRWPWMGFYLAFHLYNTFLIYTLPEGSELNKLLEKTALSILCFGINVSVLLLI